MKQHFMRTLLIVFTLALIAGNSLFAQDDSGDAPTYPDTGVWVTTQDFSSLRIGPGTAFERITVLDPEVTLPAVGRTSSVSWVQVIYEGEPGWIFSPLLIWSGDVISLPVDGIITTRFIRRAIATGITTRETPLYIDEIVPENVAFTLPEGTVVELTGRLGGESRYFRFQIIYQGELYWVGSWDIRIEEGNYRRLLDIAYIFPYGRLVSQFESNIAASVGSFQQINRIWLDLSAGVTVSCGLQVPLVVRELPEGDVAREPLFQPAVVALDNAIAGINAAITTFEDICGGEERYLDRAAVDTALAQLDNAERNLLLSASLLEPLRARNPLLRITGQ
ncbi:MAG: hypothetical protein RLP44_22200 [Aggregatilineales bacterium]